MEILTADTFEKARKQIHKSKPPIIFTSEDDELNRKILEKENINILLLNQKNRRDFMKQRNSGLNQVLAKEAKRNRVAIGINLNEIIESTGKEKSKILARIKQNVKLCNKHKLKMQFLSPSQKHRRDKFELRALGQTLGMPNWMTKNLKLY